MIFSDNQKLFYYERIGVTLLLPQEVKLKLMFPDLSVLIWIEKKVLMRLVRLLISERAFNALLVVIITAPFSPFVPYLVVAWSFSRTSMERMFK
jgi:hypothetical protein